MSGDSSLHRLVRMLEDERDKHIAASEQLEKHDMDGAMSEWKIVKAFETVMKHLSQHPNVQDQGSAPAQPR